MLFWKSAHADMMMKAAAAILGVAAPTFAQTPDEVPVSPQGTILMDQLSIVDEQVYWTGNANCWGGGAIFGTNYDMQLCDDMEVASDFQITDVTTDGLCFFGEGPVSLRIGVFADIGDEPSNDYMYDADWPVSGSSSFTDSIFGLFGVRATASGMSGVIAAGHYWVMGQLTTSGDFGGNGDWFYTPRGDQVNGEDSYARDGDREYWSYPYWRSCQTWGYGAGDSSMQVVGNAGDCYGGVLRVYGTCPGEMTLEYCRGNSGGRVAFLYSTELGEWEVPTGPCAGLLLHLVNPQIAGVAIMDREGKAFLTGFVPPRACGRLWLQAVAVDTCTPSNVMGL